MLQPAGDLGLDQKTAAADRIVGMMVEYLLKGHLAVQLDIECDKYGTQTPAGMGPQYPEPSAPTGHHADGVARGAVGVAVVAGVDAGQAGFEHGVGDPGKALASRRACWDRREAFLGIAPMLLEVAGDESLDGVPVVVVKVAASLEVVCQASRPVKSPCLKRSDELTLVDQAVL